MKESLRVIVTRVMERFGLRLNKDVIVARRLREKAALQLAAVNLVGRGIEVRDFGFVGNVAEYRFSRDGEEFCAKVEA